ncbi:hypothetical protein IC575_013309 [Cucumis melo]
MCRVLAALGDMGCGTVVDMGKDMAGVRNLLQVVAVRTSLVGARGRGAVVGSSSAPCTAVGAVGKGSPSFLPPKTYWRHRRCRFRSWLVLGVRREGLVLPKDCPFDPSSGHPFDLIDPFDSNWTFPIHEHRPNSVGLGPFRLPHRPPFDRRSSHYCFHSHRHGRFCYFPQHRHGHRHRHRCFFLHLHHCPVFGCSHLHLHLHRHSLYLPRCSHSSRCYSPEPVQLHRLSCRYLHHFHRRLDYSSPPDDSHSPSFSESGHFP